MPTYEYRCPTCGVFETRQHITEDPLKECPTCGEPVKRLISKNVGIVYKAGGFYCVDNRAEGEKTSPAGAEAEAAPAKAKDSDLASTAEAI